MPSSFHAEIPGHTLHVIQRGHGHAECFFSSDDRIAYLRWLCEYAEDTGSCVHAYALMDNHVHLLLTPSVKGGTAALMSLLRERHARHAGEVWLREGLLWEKGFDATPVHIHRYVLACMRYIELNPVRARMVSRPEQFPWSSHRCNAFGAANELLTPHSAYAVLGRSVVSRQTAYRELFRSVRPGGSERGTGMRSR
jgi:putative transposase